MTLHEAATIVARLDAIWPPKTPPTDAERDEWLRFLRPLDPGISLRGVDELRNQLGWRPSMADFRSAYNAAAAAPEETRPTLPAGPDADDTDIYGAYGATQGEWVYCWRCDMAITLDELATTAGFDKGRGFCHTRCPQPGAAPLIPRVEKLERDERFSRRRPNSEPEWTR